MHDYQRDFIELTLHRQVLRFGEFTLKSGRQSPYFFNMGRIDSGAALARLGRAYAAALVEAGIEVDMLFGPAYKGIALAAATAIALAEQHGRDLPWAFNRKEAKDHGEGGTLVGAPLKGRVLIVDDVMSAGTAARESIALIRAAGATPSAVAIALDRQEKATEAGPDGTVRDVDHSAVQYVQRQLGLQVCAIARLDDLLQYLNEQPGGEIATHRARVLAYRERYGVKES